MDALERLLAIEEIKKLKARYFRAFDTFDWELYASVFTEDAVMDMSQEATHHVGHQFGDYIARGGSPIFTGRPAIVDAVSHGNAGPGRAAHHGHMPEIEITSSTSATGIWALFDFGDYGEEAYRGYGHYFEEYRLEDGEWRISKLFLRRNRLEWHPGSARTPEVEVQSAQFDRARVDG